MEDNRKVGPALCAYLCNAFGIWIFRNPKKKFHPKAPHICGLIFALGAYLTVISLRPFPRAFNRVSGVVRIFLEFMVTSFIIETMLCDAWFPLEMFIFNTCATSVNNKNRAGYFATSGAPISSVLHANPSQTTAALWCLSLSTMYLIAILHAIRILDFRKILSPMKFTKDFSRNVRDACLRLFNVEPYCTCPDEHRKQKSKTRITRCGT